MLMVNKLMKLTKLISMVLRLGSELTLTLMNKLMLTVLKLTKLTKIMNINEVYG
jgi:hypothetical protein